MKFVEVKLTGARCGHAYDEAGRFLGAFAQAAGDVVRMPEAEAQRYLERGLAVAPAVAEKR